MKITKAILILLLIVFLTGCTNQFTDWVDVKDWKANNGMSVLEAVKYSCTQEGWIINTIVENDSLFIGECLFPNNKTTNTILYYDLENDKVKIEDTSQFKFLHKR